MKWGLLTLIPREPEENMKTLNNTLRKFAKKEKSVEDVYYKMQIAIDSGYANPDPAVQAVWKNIPSPYGKPRPEDVIEHCIRQIKI